jgi:hypothetical protein
MTMLDVFKEKIVEVNEAYPSIYTKDDVVKLLINIQNILADVKPVNAARTDVQRKINSFQDDFKTIITDKIQSYDYDDNIRLELRYDNQIETDFDYGQLSDDIEAKIDELFTELKQSLNLIDNEEEDED